MGQLVSPRGLKHMQELPSSGRCGRNHRAGVAVWKWGKSRCHKGKYVLDIRGKFRDFERDAAVVMIFIPPAHEEKLK